MQMGVCTATPAKEYRSKMAGSVDARSLPPATMRGADAWGRIANEFLKISDQIQEALKEAEAAHQGAAADAGQRAVAEMQPHLHAAHDVADGVKKSIENQVTNQNTAFQSLPAPGQKLPNGQDAIFDHPEKSWRDAPVLSWAFGDYDDKMSAFQATNQQATQVMTTYQGQSQTVLAQTPQFQPPPPPPGSNQPAPGTGMQSANSAFGGTHGSSGPSMHGSGGGAAGTRSGWAGDVGGGAGSSGSWNPGGAAGTGAQGFDGGAAAGAGGALGGAGSAGPSFAGDLGVAGAGAGVGGAAGTAGRGGMGGAGRGFGGSARGGKGTGGAKGGPGAGGRAGVGTGSGDAEGAGAGARGANAAGARGQMGGAPMNGARGRGQGEEQEHSRPSWLIETEDVFGEGVPRVAPAVFGDFDSENR